MSIITYKCEKYVENKQHLFPDMSSGALGHPIKLRELKFLCYLNILSIHHPKNKSIFALRTTVLTIRPK